MTTQSIPTELRERKQWIVREGKRPLASTNKPETWLTYSEASTRAGRGAGLGVGFVFTADDPYVGVDLDHCVQDGTIHPAAQGLIDTTLNSWWEYSPSGTGVHIIVRGELPDGFGNRGVGEWGGNIEVYDRGRYFTMTGNGTGEIREGAEAVGRVATRYLSPKVSAGDDFDWDRKPPAGEGFAGTDDELLAFAREDRHFADLFDGKTIPAGKDGDSDADFALCAKLAELVGDHPQRVERLWGRSTLAAREKWKRKDYRRRTIERGIARAIEGAITDTASLGFQRRGIAQDPIKEAITDTASIGITRRGIASLETDSRDGRGSRGRNPTAASTSAGVVEASPHVSVEMSSGAASTQPVDAEMSSDAASSPPIGRTALELRNSPRGETDWIIPGVAARGWTVLIAGREKIAGKGTLAAYLIARLERGEASVFGPASSEPVTALVLTEEPCDSIAEKYDLFDVKRSTVVFDYELAHLSWSERITWLVGTALEHGHGLIYIDNVSRAVGVSSDDESGTGLARKIEPLSSAARQHGLTVLLDHHNRKSGGKTEDLLRGGTALPGAVDNIIAIDRDGDWESRRRKLYSRGRVKSTLWKRTFELSEDGTDYVEVRGDFRLATLATKDEWTAAEFAAAIGKSVDVARRYLTESDYVEQVAGDRGGQAGGARATVYRVKDRASLLASLRDEDHEGPPL